MVFVRIFRAVVLKVWVERGLFTHRILLGEEHVDVVCTGISTKADEELIDLSEDFSFKVSFDPMNGIKSKNLEISYNYPTPLPLQPTRVSADVEEVISQNRKQAHCSHTPHYASDK
ncbi:hypothetical protein T08_12250 [Trichinella sp. T8]|nr:hypothetical protein T08_12250 [Trichinella sp. T8]